MSFRKLNSRSRPGDGWLTAAILAAVLPATSFAHAAESSPPASSSTPAARPASAAPAAPAAGAPAPAAPAGTTQPAASPAPNSSSPDADMDLSGGSTADDDALLKAISAMEEVSSAKEKSVRAKAAMTELEAVTQLPDMALGGALVSVVHRNELPSQFVLVGAQYALDDRSLFSKSDESGTLNLVGEQVVAHEHVEPGPHRLAVEYHLRGNGFGLLSYLEDIQLTVRQSFSFTVDSQNSTTVAATVYSTGNLTRQFKDRPGVSFVETVDRETPTDKQADSAKPADAGAASPAATSGQ